MVRAAYVDKNGMKKGAWTEEEDNKLRAYILRYGHWNWRLLPKFAGLQRCGKSCRLRWMNYLKPGVKRGDYNEEERHLIAKLRDELGNKWSAIAAKLPGRTDNDIKNYWHAHLKDRKKRTSKSGQKAEKSQKEELCSRKHDESEVSSGAVNSKLAGSEENCPEILSINLGQTDNSGSYSTYSEILNSEFYESFWTQPFMVDTDSYNYGHNFCLLDEGGLRSPRLSYFDDNAINMFY